MEIYLSILKDHTLGNKRGKSNTICLCFRETKCNKYLFCLMSVGLLALKGLSIHFLPLICGSRINQVVLTSLSRAVFPLLLGDPEAFPSQMRYITSALCDGSPSPPQVSDNMCDKFENSDPDKYFFSC